MLLPIRNALVLALVASLGCMGSSEQRIFSSSPPPSPGAGGGAPGSGDPPPIGVTPPPPFSPAPLRLRILLAWQYKNAIEDLLGPKAALAVTAPADTSVNGLEAIGASQLALSATAVDQYEQSSYLAAQAALADPATRDQVIGCTPSVTTDEACLRTLVTGFGKRAWRRPLDSEEVDRWVAVGRGAATAYASFYRGAEFVIAGLLQSPPFLYQVELGVPDPDAPGRRRLTGYEIATRLAFFLTGSTPSDALLAAAAAGGLDTADGIRAQAETLLASPRARAALSAIFEELFELRALSQLPKDAATYPGYGPALAASMRQETLLLLEAAAWEGGDFRDVFDADFTFVDAALAKLYDIPNPPSTGFARVAWPSGQPRSGVLTQAAFLSLMAHPVTTSPTFRGKFVRERLLCEPVSAPPNNVVTMLPDVAPDQGEMTQRERLSAHVQNASCSGCHRLMDPIGFAFESFDAIGQFREQEAGKPIDASGFLDDVGSYQDARGLGSLLRNDPRVTRCLVRTLFRAGTGHVEELGETAPLLEVEADFARSGYRMHDLLVELSASDAFRYASPETP